jgi:zinc/manganese transport system permease protein/manganese/iron transport system permease protein
MIDWLLDPLSLQFMQRALLAGVLAAVTTAVVGTWVVMRGLSFMGDALAHGVLPGIALALLLGFNAQLGAILSALVMIGGISLVHRTTRLTQDVAIGLLFVGMLALGVIIISRTGAFAVSLTAILFGDVLGVTVSDVVLQAAVAIFTCVGVVLFYRPFLVLSFNEQKAEMLGLHPRLANAMMLTLIALAVVASFQAVGSLLVFGLLVAPPATAVALRARPIPVMMLVAVVFGIVAVLMGLLISFYARTATSATIAAMSVAFFLVTLAARNLNSRTWIMISRR